MVALFAPVFVFAIVALALACGGFWRQEHAGPVSGAADR